MDFESYSKRIIYFAFQIILREYVHSILCQNTKLTITTSHTQQLGQRYKDQTLRSLVRIPPCAKHRFKFTSNGDSRWIVGKLPRRL
jgi:hypothetical protein